MEEPYSTETAHSYTVFDFADESMAETVFDQYKDENDLKQVGLFNVRAAVSYTGFGVIQHENNIITKTTTEGSIREIADEVLE